MSIRKKTAVYVASDGTEFNNEDDAKIHEELVQSISSLEDALIRFNQAAGAVQQTADGYPFELGYVSDYYVIEQSFGAIPYVNHIWFGYLRTRVIIGELGDVILENVKDGEIKRYRLDRVFKYKRNAQKRMVVDMEQWVNSGKEHLQDLKDMLAR